MLVVKDSILKVDLLSPKKNIIHVCSAMMGAGKSTGIINFMNENRGKYRFIYISPLLDEVENRIPNACPMLDFQVPATEYHDWETGTVVKNSTKSKHLLKLLKGGHNVAFTHSLFLSLTLAHLREIQKYDYCLICDEEISLLEPYGGEYNSQDIHTLIADGKLEIDTEDLGKLVWKWDDETFVDGSKYTNLKNLCEIEMLYASHHKDKKGEDVYMTVLHVPPMLVQSCEKVILLSYMVADGILDQYLSLKGMEVKEFELPQVSDRSEMKRKQAKELITIGEVSLPEEFRKKLSSTWWGKTAKPEEIDEVIKCMRNICRRSGVNADGVMYTLPKHIIVKQKRSDKPKRIPAYPADKCFVACSVRATNQYKHKELLIHAYNRYASVPVVAYLRQYGFPVDDDKWACSELVQWIYRSRIRDDQPITIYLLSSRMESILEAWLNGEIDTL